ncbi:MAG: hypothetical protein IID28_13730 [Planctomycetes bacterium]|nr:hypothetical protein [Planctomycetota bacterium]
MSHRPTFVLVGHCWADRIGLKSAVKRAVRGARVERADTMAALQKHLDGGAVFLVNRVLGGGFRTGNGVELIQDLARDGVTPAMILISNYADAQAEAEAAGALPGFGKSQLGDSAVAGLLSGAAEATVPSSGS